MKNAICLLKFSRIIKTTAHKRSISLQELKFDSVRSEDEDECAAKSRKKYPKLRDDTLRCYDDSKHMRLHIKDQLTRHNCANNPKVIIIGAGIAGLSAASRLLHCGFDNVLLFEATDRLGGRILTSWMGDTVIELGPQVIHGSSITNPLLTLASLEGLFRKGGSVFRTEKDNFNYLAGRGRIITEHDLQDLTFKLIMNQIKYVCNKSKKKKDVSLLTYLTLRVQQELHFFPPRLRPDTEKMFYGLINNLKTEFGTDLSDVSTTGLTNSVTFPGGDIAVPGGFIALLAPLIRQIPRECIKYNKRVTNICYNATSSSKVEVTFNGKEKYSSDYVIITLPLGVLQKEVDNLFIPALSAVKVNAIKSLGVGHVNKLFVEYVAPWWAPGECNLRIAWDKEELLTYPNWLKGIGAIKEIPGSKHVLSFSVSGKDALEFESLTPEQLAIDVTLFLRNKLNDSSIPFPNNLVQTRWSCDQDFLGSRSFIKSGATIGKIKDLLEPDIKLSKEPHFSPILFAGEATHTYYFGTAHGARNSGIREANRIMKYCKQKFNEQTNELEEVTSESMVSTACN